MNYGKKAKIGLFKAGTRMEENDIVDVFYAMGVPWFLSGK